MQDNSKSELLEAQVLVDSRFKTQVFENKDAPSEYILNHCELLQRHCSIVACSMHHKNLLMDFGLNSTSPK